MERITDAIAIFAAYSWIGAKQQTRPTSSNLPRFEMRPISSICAGIAIPGIVG